MVNGLLSCLETLSALATFSYIGLLLFRGGGIEGSFCGHSREKLSLERQAVCRRSA